MLHAERTLDGKQAHIPAAGKLQVWRTVHRGLRGVAAAVDAEGEATHRTGFEVPAADQAGRQGGAEIADGQVSAAAGGQGDGHVG